MGGEVAEMAELSDLLSSSAEFEVHLSQWVPRGRARGQALDQGRHKHCGSASITFERAAPPPQTPREPWWEFYVALAGPLGVNPFSGEFRLL